MPNPYDPFDAYTGRHSAERYVYEQMDRMYHSLRDEMRREITRLLDMGAHITPNGSGSNGKLHAGRKIAPVDIKALKKAQPRVAVHGVPDAVSPATGFRAWRAMLTKEGWRLWALGQDEAWEPKKPIEAKCVSGKPHPAPNFDCECGIWAFTSPEELLKALDTYTPSVIGPVSLWGRMIECENGFRSQYAYPAELWLLDNSLEELGCTYNVPIRTM